LHKQATADKEATVTKQVAEVKRYAGNVQKPPKMHIREQQGTVCQKGAQDT